MIRHIYSLEANRLEVQAVADDEPVPDGCAVVPDEQIAACEAAIAAGGRVLVLEGGGIKPVVPRVFYALTEFRLVVVELEAGEAPPALHVAIPPDQVEYVQHALGRHGRIVLENGAYAGVNIPIFYSQETRGFYDLTFHPYDLPGSLVEVTREQHAALMAAQADGKEIVPDMDGNPIAVDRTLTLAQQARALKIGGLTVTGAGAPNGTYPTSVDALNAMTSIGAGIAAGLGFPGGGDAFNYSVHDGVVTFTAGAAFLRVAAAVRNFVYRCAEVEAGRAKVLPSAIVTIDAPT
jgi:hypothetical protein